MDFRIIVTYGPSLQDSQKLKEIASLGECIFRINGAHTAPEQIDEISKSIKSAVPNAAVMLDLPGNKVRLQNLGDPKPIEKGKNIELRGEQFNYTDFPKHLKIGDVVLTHDSQYSLEVKEVKDSVVVLESYYDGTLLPNKGVHVQGINRDLPFLFEKDQKLIAASLSSSIDYLSLSFVRTAEDIRQVKSLLSESASKIQLISKIETAQAIENLGDIFFEVDIVNVDRGDLSADIGIMRLPLVQERIIDAGIRGNKQVFLATQFLSNMIENPVPLIAEVVDLYKTIKSGISGIQLSEETAVGKYPTECVDMVFQMFRKSFSSA